jgi:hypothetical protein
MTIKQLKEFIEDLPNDMIVLTYNRYQNDYKKDSEYEEPEIYTSNIYELFGKYYNEMVNIRFSKPVKILYIG